VYLRESDLVPGLDRWLLKIFEPTNLTRTLDELVAAQSDTIPDPTKERATLADYDRKLARYRAALEAGTDPAVVTEWIKQAQAELRAAESLRRLRPTPPPRWSRDQLQRLTTAVTDLAGMIKEADPVDKTKIYSGLGVRLVYHPGKRAVLAEARPAAPARVRKVRVGGPRTTTSTWSWRARNYCSRAKRRSDVQARARRVQADHPPAPKCLARRSPR
jgi:hypothetical protein